MPEVSAVIITYNEERNIARCLGSLKDVADEIIVVDSHSTDGTREICESFGARFILNRWPGYTEQKNFAIAQASHDWILSLDADEALSEELRKNLLAIKENPQHSGYYMNRMTNYCGHWVRHGSWYPDRQLRFFDRRSGRWEGEKIHERYVLKEGESPGFIQGDIHHYSYYTIEEHLAQANRFTTLTAQVAVEKGKRAGFFKMRVSPVFRFLRDFIFRLGFLDGYFGYVIARISAQAVFWKYAKIRQITASNSSEKGKLPGGKG